MPKIKVVEVRNPPPPPAPPPIVADPDADYEGWWDKQPEPEQVPEYIKEMLGNMANAGMIEVKPQPKALPLPKKEEVSDTGSGDERVTVAPFPGQYL